MKNPKQKGSAFERLISVQLSKWLSKGARDDLIWRSAMSGGRATVAKKKGKEYATQAGDLSSIHEDSQEFLSKFYVEAKHYKDLHFLGLLTSTGNLFRFWNTAVTEANSYKRQPMLIVKQNRQPPVVFMQMAGLKALGLNENQAMLTCPRFGMYGFLLADFVSWAKPL